MSNLHIERNSQLKSSMSVSFFVAAFSEIMIALLLCADFPACAFPLSVPSASGFPVSFSSRVAELARGLHFGLTDYSAVGQDGFLAVPLCTDSQAL